MALGSKLDDASDDRLVDLFEARLRDVELVVAARVMQSWREAAELRVEDAVLLLVLATRTSPSGVPELSEVSGVPVDEIYPALHRLEARRDVVEEHRRYSLAPGGRGTVALLEDSRKEGIRAFVSGLTAEERQRLATALGQESAG